MSWCLHPQVLDRKGVSYKGVFEKEELVQLANRVFKEKV